MQDVLTIFHEELYRCRGWCSTITIQGCCVCCSPFYVHPCEVRSATVFKCVRNAITVQQALVRRGNRVCRNGRVMPSAFLAYAQWVTHLAFNSVWVTPALGGAHGGSGIGMELERERECGKRGRVTEYVKLKGRSLQLRQVALICRSLLSQWLPCVASYPCASHSNKACVNAVE